MQKKEEMSRADLEKLFNERFDRLKSAMGVRSDRQLSLALEFKPQTVAGAKERHQIPVSWLEKAGASDISLDYIFYGDLPVKRKATGAESNTTQDLDPEEQIAERLVSMAISETGFSPSQSGKKILQRFVKRKVVGDIKADVIEMLKDVMMSERESETTKDTE